MMSIKTDKSVKKTPPCSTEHGGEKTREGSKSGV
jgi:hypothetical protein